MTDLKYAYQTIREITQEINKRVSSYDPNLKVRLTVFSGYVGRGDDLDVSISDYYGSSEVKVQGVDMEAMVTEFLRRKGFQATQNKLQLTLSKTIDA